MRMTPLVNPHPSPLPVREREAEQWVPWDKKLGEPRSVEGLINPEDSRQRPTTVSLKNDSLPGDSQGRPVEEDLLSWALGQTVVPGKVSSVLSRRVGRVSRRAKTSNFTQTFKSRSRGCLDGPSCALMQLATAKAQASFLCASGNCQSSTEYDSSQLASMFDGSDGVYRRLVMLHWSSPSSPPLVSRLGVPLF